MGAEPSQIDITQLVIAHHELLYRYAYRLTGSIADAEDLTQQTFLSAQANLAQLREPAAARGWLFAILRNGYRKSLKKRVPLPAVDAELNVDSVPDESRTAEPIDEERLQDALNSLSDEYKTVLLMFYFERHSYREIATQLELPIGTVMSRLSRAKSHLRAKLLDLELHATVSPRQRSDK
ncbi:MAG: sigma-70 family RNA polymerase sigma factor [Pirellulales bacterium]|nr:sigma-70 family RNA polymerase sigma factor [Pirellulales bacterium]